MPTTTIRFPVVKKTRKDCNNARMGDQRQERDHEKKDVTVLSYLVWDHADSMHQEGKQKAETREFGTYPRFRARVALGTLNHAGYARRLRT